MEHDEMIEVMVRLMFVLNKKFPFPNDLNPTAVNVDMFVQPSLPLMSSIVYYLLNIISPEKCLLLVSHPLSVQSSAQFTRGVMKFLTEAFKELPHIKIGDMRHSTLAALSGQRFIEFLARLITNTVKLAYEKYGVVSVPSRIGIDDSAELNIMQAKADRCAQELFQLRHTSAEKRRQKGLHKLKATRELLNGKYREAVSSTPSPYRGHLEGASPENAVEVLKCWQSDLKSSCDELKRERQISQIWRDAIGGNADVVSLNGPTMLERGVLLNSKNEAVISKFAEDQKIKLFEGPAISLPGFLQCSSAIIEKLSTLVVTSKLRDSIESTLSGIETSIERWSELNIEMSGLLSKTEDDMRYLNKECDDIQRKYDELVAEGEITYRFFYSQPFPNPEIHIPSFQASADLALSPGNSWSDDVADVKRKFLRSEPDSSVHTTPKRINNSSLSNLSRTVLHKQACASGSRRADFTVGEMFQRPSYSSTPVNSTGGPAYVATRKSISDVIDDVSLLDAELDEFLADVSTINENEDSFINGGNISQVEDSSQLSTQGTSGELPLPEVFQGDRRLGRPEALNPNPPPAPTRRARPSLDAIVERYESLRNKLNW